MATEGFRMILSSWQLVAKIFNSTIAMTTDFGTEAALAIFPRFNLKEFFPWVDDEDKSQGPAPAPGDDEDTINYQPDGHVDPNPDDENGEKLDFMHEGAPDLFVAPSSPHLLWPMPMPTAACLRLLTIVGLSDLITHLWQQLFLRTLTVRETTMWIWTARAAAAATATAFGLQLIQRSLSRSLRIVTADWEEFLLIYGSDMENFARQCKSLKYASVGLRRGGCGSPAQSYH